MIVSTAQDVGKLHFVSGVWHDLPYNICIEADGINIKGAGLQPPVRENLQPIVVVDDMQMKVHQRNGVQVKNKIIALVQVDSAVAAAIKDLARIGDNERIGRDSVCKTHLEIAAIIGDRAGYDLIFIEGCK